jgi:hypothetical protein
MKKSIIYIALIFAVFGCKDEEIQEPTLLSLIPGRYSFRWYETEPGTNYAIAKGGGYDGGFVEFSIDANNLITLKGRSAAGQDIIYFPKFFYKEVNTLYYDLYLQKNDIRRTGSFWYDKSGIFYDKSVIRVAFSLDFTDSIGKVYQISGEKLGK